MMTAPRISDLTDGDFIPPAIASHLLPAGLLRDAGFTAIEGALYAFLLVVILGAIVGFVRSTLSGLTSSDARGTIIAAVQESVDRLQHETAVSRRIFDRSSDFPERIDLTSAPAPLIGTQLPVIELNGSLSSASTNFVQAGVGNALFFAQNLGQQDMTVGNSSLGSRTYRIDTYRFDYFYLSSVAADIIGGQPRLGLVEWRSAVYANASDIQGVTDPVASANLINELMARGIHLACDLSQNSAASAFFSLGTNTLTPVPEHHIVMSATLLSLQQSVTGGGSFRYGISPNTSGLLSTKDVVPLYAQAAGSFPGGFEVVVVGPSSSRQILARLVMAAVGSMAPQSYQQVAFATVNDTR
jgi:hypothetical protein